MEANIVCASSLIRGIIAIADFNSGKQGYLDNIEKAREYSCGP